MRMTTTELDENYTADEKLARLREEWKVEDDGYFTGKIVKATYNDFYLVDSVYTSAGLKCFYPDKTNIKYSIIVRGKQGLANDIEISKSGLKNSDYVKFYYRDIKISADKYQNETKYKCNINIKKLSKIEKIEKKWLEKFFSSNGENNYIDDWVIQLLSESKKIEIDEDIENYKKQKESEKKEIETKNEKEIDEIIQSKEKAALEAKKEIDKNTEIIDSQLKKIENETTKLDTIKSEKEKAENLIKSHKNEINILKILGVFKTDNSIASDITDKKLLTKKFEGDRQEVVNYIYLSLKENQSYYQYEDILNFTALLNTNDIIILAGDSGTGKTNLVKGYANAIGAESRIISVKPNWTSAEDLLGFYNPLDKRYISTPFLDALLEATRNPNKLFLICLDEMNLSRVEYYFSDFLSQLEERNSNPIINLYSKYEYDLLTDEINELTKELLDFNEIREILNKLDLDNTDINTILKNISTSTIPIKNREINEIFKSLKKLASQASICTTGANFVYPENIRIIGTMNVDDTTYYLSNKILDRVHIIKFKNPIDFFDKIVFQDDKNINNNFKFNYDFLFDKREKYPSFSELPQDVRELLIYLYKQLKPLGITISLRILNQFVLYKKSMEIFGEKNTYKILDKFILQKILPKFMFDGSENTINTQNITQTKLDYLENIFLNYILSKTFKNIESESKNELKNMIAKAKANNNFISFWSR